MQNNSGRIDKKLVAVDASGEGNLMTRDRNGMGLLLSVYPFVPIEFRTMCIITYLKNRP